MTCPKKVVPMFKLRYETTRKEQDYVKEMRTPFFLKKQLEMTYHIFECEHTLFGHAQHKSIFQRCSKFQFT